MARSGQECPRSLQEGSRSGLAVLVGMAMFLAAQVAFGASGTALSPLFETDTRDKTYKGIAYSGLFTTDTRDRQLTSVSVGGDATIESGQVKAYQCTAGFSDGTWADVSASATWTIEDAVPRLPRPAGTMFSANLLTAGSTPTAQTIYLRAAYTHRGPSGEVTRQSPELAVAIQPKFLVSFSWRAGDGLYQYILSATAKGTTWTPVTFTWDLDVNGVFDNGSGAEVTVTFPAARTYLVGVRGVDAHGNEAINRMYLPVEYLPRQGPVVKGASDVLDGSFLNASFQPFATDPARAQRGLVIITHGLCRGATDTWLGDMARAMEGRFGPTSVPNICLYDWSDMSNPDRFQGEGTSCGADGYSFAAGKLAALFEIKQYGLAHGLILADWLKQQVAAGNVKADKPIHLIGHSAGGFVMGECAKVLKQAGVNVSQVTILDTPDPVGDHVTAYPNPGKVDRYISSCFGKYAPFLDGTGCDCDGAECVQEQCGFLFQLTDELSRCRPRVEPTAFYHRYEIPGANSHGYVHDWYTGTILDDGLKEGFWYSPWLGNSFPAGAGAGGAAFAAAPPPEAPPQPIADFQTFGRVALSNGVYTLTEAMNAGIYKPLEMPAGAQKLRFRYRFATAGDGDFLSVHWGTNTVLYIGLDRLITRSNLLAADVPVEVYAGQTNELVFKLVSRGVTNAVLLLDQIELTVSDDPDGDGLTTDQEVALGTNPLAYDTDGDGLSDGAEVNVHHTNPLARDSDGDGVSDADELAAGTNPNDAQSAFRVLRLVRTSDTSVTLEWTGATSRYYRVHRSTTPSSEAYTTLTNGLPGVAPLTTFMDSNATNATLFYWVDLDSTR